MHHLPSSLSEAKVDKKALKNKTKNIILEVVPGNKCHRRQIVVGENGTTREGHEKAGVNHQSWRPEAKKIFSTITNLGKKFDQPMSKSRISLKKIFILNSFHRRWNLFLIRLALLRF